MYDDNSHYGIPYKELYQNTLKQQDMYVKEGYRVFVVWEHEYKTTKRAKCPVCISLMSYVRSKVNHAIDWYVCFSLTFYRLLSQ